MYFSKVIQVVDLSPLPQGMSPEVRCNRILQCIFSPSIKAFGSVIGKKCHFTAVQVPGYCIGVSMQVIVDLHEFPG